MKNCQTSVFCCFLKKEKCFAGKYYRDIHLAVLLDPGVGLAIEVVLGGDVGLVVAGALVGGLARDCCVLLG